MTTGLLPIRWVAREPPLVPSAVAAVGTPALRLAERLLRFPDEELARYTGVAGPGVLVILAEPERLPWTDGVVYLGRDPNAPTLLMPTNIAPEVPAALVERSIQQRYPSLPAPMVFLPQFHLLTSAVAARSVYRAAVESWLGVQVR